MKEVITKPLAIKSIDMVGKGDISDTDFMPYLVSESPAETETGRCLS